MSCTKLFYKWKTRARVFGIFDKDKPYEVTLYYKRIIPKSSGGSGLGFGLGLLHYSHVQKLDFVLESAPIRVPNENMIINKLREGFCYKCGHVSKCKYINLALINEANAISKGE